MPLHVRLGTLVLFGYKSGLWGLPAIRLRHRSLRPNSTDGYYINSDILCEAICLVGNDNSFIIFVIYLIITLSF
jgi:hypothetical protein